MTIFENGFLVKVWCLVEIIRESSLILILWPINNFRAFKILFTIATVNAIVLKKVESGPSVNTEDWGVDFNDRHYTDNNVKGTFKDSYATEPRNDNPWVSSKTC